LWGIQLVFNLFSVVLVVCRLHAVWRVAIGDSAKGYAHMLM